MRAGGFTLVILLCLSAIAAAVAALVVARVDAARRARAAWDEYADVHACRVVGPSKRDSARLVWRCSNGAVHFRSAR